MADLRVITPTGAEAALGQSVIEEFASNLRGGLLRRKYGLSCDNLLSADVVSADGRLLTASETENADHFWGIRGGGGNFGVVTTFEYRLHPVGPEMMAAAVMYPFGQATELLHAWRDYTEQAPDEVTSEVLLWSIPDIPDFPEELRSEPTVVVAGMYAGPAEAGERELQPLREFGNPTGGSERYTTLHRGAKRLRCLFP
jgi:FAD/FMN-containing dehydrogenase